MSGLKRAGRGEAEISKALLGLAEALAGLQSLDRLLEAVTQLAPQLLGVKRCGLFRFDPEKEILIPTKAWGLSEELRPAFLALRGAPAIPAVVKATQSLEPVVVEAEVLHTLIPRKVATALDIRSMLVIPLVSGGRLIGTMGLDSPGVAHAFTPKQIAIARGIAAQAAVAIDTARRYEEVRQAVEDLKAAQGELVRRETLRAAVELSAGIAHHLNNLMAVVLMRAELLLAEDRTPEIRRTLEIIKGVALDAAEVVRRLHRFSHVGPEPELVPVDLNRLLEETLGMVDSLWAVRGRNLGVRIEGGLEPGEIPPVMGNPSALREVLMNLLINAGEAMPAGGTIAVKTWATGGWVHCAVSDPGVGMPEEVRRRAFEPFFTTRGPKAAGLGLSLAYGVIQRHRGELVLESAEGRGTIVTIHLPAAVAGAGAS
ncbi:MAG: GAF domain-containing sensor histidine kinase [Candidatus Rokubacteria bacterium]|nr:GAF domain-containing sensor histidine kinase [Candidatus Rokubacteria bacterium]